MGGCPVTRDRAIDIALIARRRLAETFGTVSLDAFGTFSDGEAVAAAMAVDYIRSTQSGALPRLGRPEPQGHAGASADGCRDSRESGDPAIAGWRDRAHAVRGGSADVDGGGARALAAWLSAPLTDPVAITVRQDAWSWCVANPDATSRLRPVLRTAPDMARALGRLSLNRGTPRDLAAIKHGLEAATEVAKVLHGAFASGAGCARAAVPSGSTPWRKMAGAGVGRPGSGAA